MEGVSKCPQTLRGVLSAWLCLTLGDLSNCPRRADFRTPVSCSSWECQSHLVPLSWKWGPAKLPAVSLLVPTVTDLVAPWLWILVYPALLLLLCPFSAPISFFEALLENACSRSEVFPGRAKNKP